MLLVAMVLLLACTRLLPGKGTNALPGKGILFAALVLALAMAVPGEGILALLMAMAVLGQGNLGFILAMAVPAQCTRQQLPLLVEVERTGWPAVVCLAHLGGSYRCFLPNRARNGCLHCCCECHRLK